MLAALSSRTESVPPQQVFPSPAHQTNPLNWQVVYLSLLPRIRNHARYAFRHLRGDERKEAIQETLANSCVACARLVERGEAQRAAATPLARFAVAQVRVGRRVGGRLNSRDVLTEAGRLRHGCEVKKISHRDVEHPAWEEIVVEDHHAGPAEIAATRIDFRSWLDSLSARRRKIAEALAMGESTSQVAELFRISAARVSQLRGELYVAWKAFQGEAVAVA